jgi:hypothetical protein
LSVATRTLCVTARNGARIERVFQRNKHQRRLQRCRTNKNSVGDFRDITRTFAALIRSQLTTCLSRDAPTRGMLGTILAWRT